MKTNNRTTSKSRLQRYLLPSLTGRGWGVGLLSLVLSAALTMQASAYTVTPADEAPQWAIDWSGNEERPDWQEPDASAFASFAVMIVTVEEALQPYGSADDLMAIFVGDELRGLASPLVKGNGTVDATRFLLKGYSNESAGDEVVVTMTYYNALLKQVFSLSESMTLDEDNDLGIYEDFIPPFTLGSPAYPEVTTLNAASILAEEGITPAKGDMVAAFVKGECRGVSPWPMTEEELGVLLREADEPMALKYYDAANKRILTFGNDGSILPGDVNGDGVVNVIDVTMTISYILGQNPADFNAAAADVSGDGVVNILDLTTIIDMILGK